MEKIKDYIGTKVFYMHTASIAIPLGLQQLVTSCMGIIDSLMVSWIGQCSRNSCPNRNTLFVSFMGMCCRGWNLFSTILWC